MSMQSRSSNPQRPRDVNQLAKSIVEQATVVNPAVETVEDGKNAPAVALGRLKGGKSRTEKLTKAQRSEIAKKAAKARWGDK